MVLDRKISDGLARYQRKKRRQSEDNVLMVLLMGFELSGMREVWRRTRIYKNNVRPILDKLVHEGRVFSVTDSIIQTFDDKNDYSHSREVHATVYLPNMRDPYMIRLLLCQHKGMLGLLGYYSIRKKIFRWIWDNRYTSMILTHPEQIFVREVGGAYGRRDANYKLDLEIVYYNRVGMSLFLIVNMIDYLCGHGFLADIYYASGLPHVI